MPKISALGGMSSRGFGEFAQQTAANYIEDVFSTYLYNGTGSTQTITNGVDLSGKGGLVWTKSRSTTYNHQLYDTARGTTKAIFSNLTDAQLTLSTGLTAFNASGYTLGANGAVNDSTATYASWTFRKQPKFFDVITYTGDGSTSWRYINHNLAATPAMIIVKNLSRASDWLVYSPIAAGSGYDMILNSTAPSQSSNESQGRVYATSATQFQVICKDATGNNVTGTNVNQNGDSYVAYLFASNAGGFGADGSQNVISCGSYTGNGSNSGPSINLGWEPQWVMIKRTDTSGNWWMMDVMRGMSQTDSLDLQANASTGDLTDSVSYARPLATGFSPGTSYSGVNASGGTYIYLAIRRGPMRTPTSGTSVFSPILNTGGNGSTKTITGIGFAPDAVFGQARNAGFLYNGIIDRLRGVNKWLSMQLTDAEGSYTNSISQLNNNSWVVGADSTGSYNYSTYNYISWNFGRAPGFFDVACYTGTGVATTQAHNLGVAPELMIFKSRNTAGTNWAVCVPLTPTTYNYLTLQSTNSANNRTYGPGGSPNFEELSAPPTSSVINLASSAELNASGRTFVAYLFATCPGVSKVGSYTGTGATQTISCGFTGGARYVLIKRTDSTGSWYVWDSARGMVAGTDPSLLLNTTAAEVNANSIYTTTGGFQIVSTAADINASGGTYLYLSIA